MQEGNTLTLVLLFNYQFRNKRYQVPSTVFIERNECCWFKVSCCSIMLSCHFLLLTDFSSPPPTPFYDMDFNNSSRSFYLLSGVTPSMPSLYPSSLSLILFSACFSVSLFFCCLVGSSERTPVILLAAFFYPCPLSSAGLFSSHLIILELFPHCFHYPSFRIIQRINQARVAWHFDVNKNTQCWNNRKNTQCWNFEKLKFWGFITHNFFDILSYSFCFWVVISKM